MNFNPQYFDILWIILGALAYGWILIKAIRSAQWWRLREARDLNVLLYAILGVLFIWSMNTSFAAGQLLAGLNLHLLGATLMTLMFGWAFAIIAMSLVILASTLLNYPLTVDNLLILPWNALVSCVLPIFLSHRLFQLVDTRLPNNFFIYIFLCAFFGAALAMSSVVLTSTALQYLSGAYSYEKLSYNYIPYGLILMLPEAFITGMLMTIFIVYRPQWVSTFDDKRYLKN